MTTHAAESPLKANIDRKRGGRRRVPTILQMEATECGAACLGMVLAHFGRWVPPEEIRIACGVSRDGSKANNVLRAARDYGLVAKGYRRDPKRVFDLPFPMIVFWNFNHFVVLEGMRGNRVYINDPANGPRTLTMEEFDLAFTGVVLAFARGPDFRRGGDRPNVYSGLWRRLGVSKLALVFVLLATLALVIPGLAIPVFSKIFIDDVLIRASGSWVLPLLIGMGLTALMRGALTWLQQAFLARLEVKLAITASARFFWHVMRLPVEFFAQRYAGDLSSRVAANDRIAQLITGELTTNAINLLSILFYGVVMALYDPLLAAVGIGMTLLSFVALQVVSGAREDANRHMLKEQGKLAGTSVNGIQMIETLKAGGTEADFFGKWAGHQANMLAAQQRLGLYSHVLNVVPTLIQALTTVAVLGLGGLRIVDGALTLGGLVAFQSLLQSFSQPVLGLVRLGGSLQTVKGDIARLDDVLNYPPDLRLVRAEMVEAAQPGRGATDARSPAEPMSSKLSGAVELRNVTFGYSRREPPLLRGLDLSIAPGRRVALVGGSGSGKSTVARILCGLLQPWSGEVLFDGRPLESIPRPVFAASVSFVDQDIVLYEGTVRDNVALWEPSLPEIDLTRALADAAILDVVSSRPGRADGHVEENGVNFSGGQRQRIEIARALATNPSILVLDEATAALDPLVELEIDGNLRRRGATCVIVAHRLSTIRDADEIIVFESGQVVQRGTHEMLIQSDGPYRRLTTLA